MIISASRRTDIPAYFGKKFYNNLIKLKKFVIVNPFNNKKTELNFKKSEIDGIVFWTKNPLPFINIVKKIKSEGYKFYFHYTLNNYPYSIEPLKFNVRERIFHLKNLYEIIYPYKIFYRYDPIILTENFNINFHVKTFEFILEKINPYIDRIIVSFITVYRKIKMHFNNVITEKEKEIELLLKLKKISDKYEKNLYVCCYNQNLKEYGILPSKCIDASIFNVKGIKHKGQRNLCNCDKSVDVGFYHTCKTGCLYCYAK